MALNRGEQGRPSDASARSDELGPEGFFRPHCIGSPSPIEFVLKCVFPPHCNQIIDNIATGLSSFGGSGFISLPQLKAIGAMAGYGGRRRALYAERIHEEMRR